MLTSIPFPSGHFHAARAVLILLIWIGTVFCADLDGLSESNRLACVRVPKSSGEGWAAFAAGGDKILVYAQQNRSIQLRCDGTVEPGHNTAFDQKIRCNWAIRVQDGDRDYHSYYHPGQKGKPLCGLTIVSFDGEDNGGFECTHYDRSAHWNFTTEMSVSPSFGQEIPTVSASAHVEYGTLWTFICPVASTPAPCIRWYSHGKELKVNERDIHGCNVTGSIMTCQMDQFSTLQPFTCTASNAISFLSYQFPNISLTSNMVKDALTSGSLESTVAETTDNSSALPTEMPSLCNCSCDSQTSTESPSDATTLNSTNISFDGTLAPVPADEVLSDPREEISSKPRQRNTLDVASTASNVRHLVMRNSYEEEPAVEGVLERPSLASRPFSDFISVGVACVFVFNIF